MTISISILSDRTRSLEDILQAPKEERQTEREREGKKYFKRMTYRLLGMRNQLQIIFLNRKIGVHSHLIDDVNIYCILIF